MYFVWCFKPRNRKSILVKKLYPKLFLFLTLLISFHLQVFSQPIPDTATTGWPGGLATLKWDNRNYLVTTGYYAGYVTAAMSTTQAFFYWNRQSYHRICRQYCHNRERPDNRVHEFLWKSFNSRRSRGYDNFFKFCSLYWQRHLNTHF